MLNPQYSLFTDTSAYFLTWHPSASTKRFEDINNDLGNLPAAESSFIYEQLTNYTAKWNKAITFNHDVDSEFTTSEGFSQFLQNQQTFSLQPHFLASGATSADLLLRLTTDLGSHQLVIDVNDSNYTDETFSGYRVKEYEYNIPLSGNNPSINVEIESQSSQSDRHALSNVILRYPRSFDFAGANSFIFEIAAGPRKYLEISNFDAAGGMPLLYDINNGQRLVGVVEGGIVKIALPASNENRSLILINSNSGYEAITSGRLVNFIDYQAADPEYLILSHPALFNDGQGNNRVQEYVDYRSSAEGGNYDVLLVEIQQLYDQFAYGINRHNIAVRNFANFAKKEWDNWQFALLIGKSRQYDETRTTEQLNLSTNQSYYLPTYSSPGADVLMFAPMNDRVPVVAVGRIAAETPDEVRIYLDKIKTYEAAQINTPQTIDDKLWMKRVMHLGGGIDANQQNQLRNHLEFLGDILVKGKFGAELTSFYKTSTDPIQESQSEELTNLINDGVSMITFFGHSSPNSFDFSLDKAESYENEDKYSIISSYGCFAGQIHNGGTKSIGEEFIFADRKGAIGFIASVGQGYINDLRNFGEYYYNQVGNDAYGKSIGNILKSTIRHYQNVGGTFRFLLQQTIFQGDPALRLNPQLGPDFIVDTKSVDIQPSTINIDVVDSMSVHFDIVNIGINNKDSILVKMEQELPDGTIIPLLEKKLLLSSFRNSFSFKFPTQGEKSIGKNLLYVTVDSDNAVEELPQPAAENNNELRAIGGIKGLNFFVFSNDARPLYPSKYGITSDRNLILKATTTNTFIGNQKYIIQIDTTLLFNSVAKKETTIEQEGGVIKWQPNVDYQNNTVYYWRISPDSSLTNGLGYLWQETSFLFLEGVVDGWNQSHYFQYLENTYNNMELEEDRLFKYTDNIYSIEVRNSRLPIGPAVVVNSTIETEAAINITDLQRGLFVSVFDEATGLLLENSGEDFGSDVPDGWAPLLKAFTFELATQEDRAEAINFLQNEIPSGAYVIVSTIQQNATNAYYSELWATDSLALGTNLFQILEEQGATRIREMEDNPLPYTFVYKKNDSEFQPQEDVGILDIVFPIDSVTSTKFDVIGSWDNGKVASTLIGPASKWNQLFWGSTGFDEAYDTEALTVYGIDKNGQRARLVDNITATEVALTDINAADFPYLQLEYATTDLLKRSTPQLEHWRVYYSGIPEASLDKNALFEFYADTLQQGEQLQFRIAAENISDYDMDSLLVKFSITDDNNAEQVVKKRLQPLLKGDTLIAGLTYNTKNLIGKQTLTVEINPDDDQPEQLFINNVGFVDFFVEKDKRNPALDVTFDGLHIMDGDIVAPSPLIVITMEDENQFLALTDTALFELFLVYPGEDSPREIDLMSNEVQFYPAVLSEGKNKARIEFSPAFEQNGNHRLIVKGKDATGNHSGRFNYEVEFEVIKENMISNVLNYPNPFSTATHFVYTLTGHAPAFFKIQILSISGRVVKEITQADLGELKIGTHRTDYAWDGTDEFGDRLANGVYLYRVIAKDAEGNNYDAYSTEVDGFFKNDFGKLVILR